MEFHYPNGKKFVSTVQSQPISSHKEKERSSSHGKRGMTLEEDLNETNRFYLEKGKAVIHKKPTPIQIVNVDYPKRSAAVIKEAYFKQASTTDYNGVYNGYYIDFEAKETRNKNSFPLQNFHEHQLIHMEQIEKHKGIGFVIIRFSSTEEIYLLPYNAFKKYWDRMINGGRKSMTKDEIMQDGYPLTLGLQPRIDYLKIVDHLCTLSDEGTR
ncbi:Holliday junction resolvase RecU [Jeotgalibacillus proteolyticus]|uniref:Holliday junction resolvase RecU n=1 Tax=Jeotgalibacillus proteolyticus TaxID=2082395 RepID=A0A2S5GE13_9BACL|nr:Holliday junction resolvase RecU [Jeotgalibacillus proteolyticus]PPA71229.1 Holliday junction resolvase RecU [Jeotgalibacillus proteolyticus]